VGAEDEKGRSWFCPGGREGGREGRKARWCGRARLEQEAERLCLLLRGPFGAGRKGGRGGGREGKLKRKSGAEMVPPLHRREGGRGAGRTRSSGDEMNKIMLLGGIYPTILVDMK